MQRFLWAVVLLGLCIQVNAEEIIVSAAASLTNALQRVAQDFSATHPQTTVRFNWGGSGTLARQIEAGAPVDLFVSASDKVMDSLQTSSLIDPASRSVLVHNQLVLIVPAQSETKIHDFTDLAEAKKISIGDPRFVPAGMYATEVFQFYDLTQQVQAHLILASHVRQVLTYVAEQDVEAGLVYKTDALEMADKVRIAAYAPEDSHLPIVYPAAIVKASQHKQLAQEFLNYLNTREAKVIFAHYGFQTP
jgi:molybdate transport system substrate-binding protein